jgi:hypothetical protein
LYIRQRLPNLPCPVLLLLLMMRHLLLMMMMRHLLLTLHAARH